MKVNTDLSGSLYLASSALQAKAVEMQISSHNIANISTDGFKPYKVFLADGSHGYGTRVDAILADVPAAENNYNLLDNPPQDAQSVTDKTRPSGTELAKDIVHFITNQHVYEANAKVVGVADEMLDTILNIKI